MKNKEIYISVKDYSVSGEDFQLIYNQEMDMLETYPQPALDKLQEYYKSDDYISHTDTKRNVFEIAYHAVRKCALKKKLKYINAFSNEGKHLLDVGCGTGDFLKSAKDDHWIVCGIEPNEKARNIANSKTDNSVFDIDRLSKLEAHSFDVITLWHVLEHLPNLETYLLIFKKLLKPNGTLIIAVPNYKSFDAKHYKKYWAAFDAPRHLWHFSRTAISKFVAKEKMHVIKTCPMFFDAFYVSLLSEKYKTGKMNFIKGFWIGLVSNIKAIKSKEYASLIYIVKNG